MSVIVSLQSKVCSKCREVKTLDGFSKQRASKDGHQSKCKVCKKDYDDKYRAANPEKERERHANYRAANPDYNAKYYAAHPEKKKEHNATYRAAHPEKVKESNDKYRAANPEKIKEYDAKYCAANSKQRRDYHAKWCAANPEKRRANDAKRRAAKLLAIPFWLTEEDYKAIEAIYAEAKRLEAETGLIYHVDHIHPLQGVLVCGLHCPNNLQILTEAENCSKGNKFKPYVESDLTCQSTVD